MRAQRRWRLAWLATTGIAGSAVLLAALAADPGRAAGGPGWDPVAAERYLDAREVAWQAWDRTWKDRGTLCISCHTQASYGLARPILRQVLGETGMPPAEQAMLASIEKRVRLWKQMQPFYSDVVSGAGKEIESHDAESVLNAVILSSYDARRPEISDDARTAYSNAWALQSRMGSDAGAWVWQNFGYAPWESSESEYHWAALMAVAVGKAPGGYRDDPAIAANLAALAGYLQSRYEAQPVLNKVVALWASRWFPGIVDPPHRAALLETLYGRQHPDGGWSMTDLGPWVRRDASQPRTVSDGYATAVATLVLEEVGERPANPHLQRSLAWLAQNQDPKTGAWPGWSVNKDRDPASMEGHFMTDAATAYAVLALEARASR